MLSFITSHTVRLQYVEQNWNNNLAPRRKVLPGTRDVQDTVHCLMCIMRGYDKVRLTIKIDSNIIKFIRIKHCLRARGWILYAEYWYIFSLLTHRSNVYSAMQVDYVLYVVYARLDPLQYLWWLLKKTRYGHFNKL